MFAPVSALLLAMAAPAAPAPFSCTVTGVHDGDGPIYCAEGPRVRRAGIAAREIDESGRAGHPCPAASGRAARAALARLTQRRVLRCAPTGLSYGRIVARCSAGGVDLSCSMVRGGHALRWARYDREGALAGCGAGR